MKSILKKSMLLLFAICFTQTAVCMDQAPDRTAFEEVANHKWHEIFFDSCSEDWKKKWFLDGEVGVVSTDSEGMELTAGPRYGNDADHMVLWTKDSFKGDLKIEYEYTRLDSETRGVTILYIQATGSGTDPYKTDLSKWNELRRVPAMRMYFDHMNAYHISYAAFQNTGENRKGYIRARRYLPEKSGLQGTGLEPDYYPDNLFEPGIPHRIVVIKKERDLYLRIENPDQVFYGHMANPDFPPVEEGRIGLRHMFTRSARYRNFRISEN